MKQIAVRHWTDVKAERFAVMDPGSKAVLSIDASCRFLDGRSAQATYTQGDAADGSQTVAWRTDVADGTVTAVEIQPGVMRFRCDCRVVNDFESNGISWSFRLSAHEPLVLDSRFRMVRLNQSYRLNQFTPLALRGRSQGQWIGIVSPDSTDHDWAAAEGNHVTGTIWLDHPLAHPRFTFEGPQHRNWHNNYFYSSGTLLRRELYVVASPRPEPLLVLGRFPARNRAVFSITDHADHDSCERLAALWYGTSRDASPKQSAGFVGLGLPFTKSVFTATPAAEGPGLHYAPFAELCRQGHAAGIEICPHGVHSTVQPAVSELDSLLRPFEEFRPLTWIDHGNRFLSNYGRRGWNPHDDYSLLSWLDRLGIKYVWGRLDFGQSLPGGQLDQVSVKRFCGWSYIRDLPTHGVRSLRASRPWAVLHGMSSIAFQLVPERTMRQYFLAQREIQRVMKADVAAIPGAVWQSGRMAAALALPPGLTDLCRHVGGVREELSRSPIFFPEHDAVHRRADDRWLFNTIAVHDVAAAYSTRAIDRLIGDYGVHLSHTYLTSVSSAHLSHAIERDGAQDWRLTDAFDNNLKGIGDRRDAGRLWVASMGEVGEFWRGRSQSRLVPTHLGRWQLDWPDHAGQGRMDLQVVVIGAADDRPQQIQSIRCETLHDEMQIGAVNIGAGESIQLDCRA